MSTSRFIRSLLGAVLVTAAALALAACDEKLSDLTGPTPDGVYTLERYETFMRAMLDHLGIDRCVLAGNSFGGTISMVTALAMPERVEKLVLVDSGGYSLRGVSMPIGFKLANTPVINRLAAVVLPRGVIESSVRDV